MKTAVLKKDLNSHNHIIEKPIFQVFSQKPKLPILKMEYKELKLEFKKPYSLTIKAEEGYLIHENKKLNMIINGKTLEELVDEFFSSMYYLWHDIAKEDESKLHTSAIKLKEYLLSLVKEI